MALSSCVSIPDQKEMIYVGYMQTDCSSVINKESIIVIPVGFKLTPTQAAKALPNGCGSKFYYGVYADEKYYYFADNVTLSFKSRNALNIRKYSYKIDATTGLLVEQ